MNAQTAKRILCVDDDEDTCSMLCSLLGLIECHAISTGTASAALDKIHAERFDLYLLDNWLPGDDDGTQLCKKIREFDTTTPIVFYSGAAYDTERQAALAAGAQAYLIKPHDISLLLKTVKQLLQLH